MVNWSRRNARSVLGAQLSSEKARADYAALLYETRANGLYDGFGVAMSWLFALADYATFETGDGVPPEWEYRPAMGGADSDSHEYQTLIEFAPDSEALELLGRVLWRYRSKLEIAGKTY